LWVISPNPNFATAKQLRLSRLNGLNPATAGQARSTGTLGHLPQPVGHIPQNNKVKEIQILDDNYITT